jgi:hypothetical protein
LKRQKAWCDAAPLYADKHAAPGTKSQQTRPPEPARTEVLNVKNLQAKRSICLTFGLLALGAVSHFGVSVAGAEAPAAASGESMAGNTASAGVQPIGVYASP